jgi:hypothetical protein
MGRIAIIDTQHPPTRRYREAAILAARVAPAGSVNIEALSKQRHIAGRRQLEDNTRGLELVGEMYASAEMASTLERIVPGFENAVGPDGDPGSYHLFQYTRATDSGRLIKITAIEPKMVTYANCGERYLVTTEEGEMLLRPGTAVVWD